MIPLGICVAGLVAAWLVTRRSVAAGCLVVLTFGYFYGIVRANLPAMFSHFIFDAAIIGFYIALPWQRYFSAASAARLRGWVAALIALPLLLFLVPLQHPLVQAVGLRGHVFFLPVLLVGAMLTLKELRMLCTGLAALNLVALAFGIAEYYRGVPAFYPFNAATQLIYISGDVAGGFFRIPAIFSNAHSYAGTMVATLPFLLGELNMKGSSSRDRILLVAGALAAVMGVLMASTRLFFVVCAIVLCIAAFASRSAKSRALVLCAIALAAILSISNPRFQRYKSLDADIVSTRIQGSVNRSLLEIIGDYPLGNGLGGAGTSLPYFLVDLVRNPISTENEYGRIALEQGIPGLALWCCFLGWFFTRREVFWKGPWRVGRVTAYGFVLIQFAVSLIGSGTLTAIPGTFMLLLTMGWLTAAEPGDPKEEHAVQPLAAWVPSTPLAYRRRLRRASA